MQTSTSQTIFAIACLLCFLAIAVGAALEILRQKRGESLLRPGQFRLRILSALIWMIALGALAYAVAFLMPQPHFASRMVRLEMAKKFLSVVSGALSLIFIALVLLAYDWWQLARERKIKEAQFQLNLANLALEEIQKAQLESQQQSNTAGEIS